MELNAKVEIINEHPEERVIRGGSKYIPAVMEHMAEIQSGKVVKFTMEDVPAARLMSIALVKARRQGRLDESIRFTGKADCVYIWKKNQAEESK